MSRSTRAPGRPSTLGSNDRSSLEAAGVADAEPFADLVGSSRHPAPAAGRRQRFARALLAGTVLSGSVAIGGGLAPGAPSAWAASGNPTPCSSTGTNASGGEAGYTTPSNSGYGGCEGPNTTTQGQDGSAPAGQYGGGGGGAGADHLTAAGAGGSGDGNLTAGGAGGTAPGQAGADGAPASQSSYAGGGGGGGANGTVLGASGAGATGGNGGNAGSGFAGTQSEGGGGGGGGVGTIVTAGQVTLTGASTGGNGGSGGNSDDGGTGVGGQGGVGVIVAIGGTGPGAPTGQGFILGRNVVVMGGTGGVGGHTMTSTDPSPGGDGGPGAVVLNGASLTIEPGGSIYGGSAGDAGSLNGTSLSNDRGGNGARGVTQTGPALTFDGGSGVIQGGDGGRGRIGGNGGRGVVFTPTTGSLTILETMPDATADTIRGGNGGVGGYGGVSGLGGHGANGIVFSSDGTLSIGGPIEVFGGSGATSVFVEDGAPPVSAYGGDGVALASTSSLSLQAGAVVTGGTGGTGNSVSGTPGTGGTGGAGASGGSSLGIAAGASLTGGVGGVGGTSASGAFGGSGGQGGSGIATDGATIANAGSIVGGAGGVGGTGTTLGGVGGPGGAGIVGSDLSVTSSGTIAGGLSGDGATQAEAIIFTGGANTLTLQSGFTLRGDIAVSGSLTFAQTDDVEVTNLAGVGTTGITGPGSLTKTGPGTLILSGSNTYFGGTTIQQGAIEIDAAAGTTSMSLGTGAVLLNGGTLAAVPQNGSNYGFTLGNAIQVGAAGGVIDLNNNSITLTGTIANGAATPGVLTFSDTNGGGQVLTLSGANSFTGGSAITSGAFVESGTPNALGTGALQVGSGGAFFLGGYDQSVTTLTGTGGLLNIGSFPAPTTSTLTVQSGNFGGLIEDGTSSAPSGARGVLALTKVSDGSASGGTLILAGQSYYTGDTNVMGGTLQAGSTTGFANYSAFTVAAGATLDLGGFDNSVRALSGAGLVTNSGSSPASLSVGKIEDTSSQFDGTLLDGASALGLTKVGAGTLILTGTNSYSGGTTIGGGTLQIGDGGTAGSIAGDVVDNAILAFNRSDTLTFTGAISGTGALDQMGSGTLDLTGTSTYTGPTTVQSGRLAVNGALGNTAVTIDSGATLGGSGTIAGGVTIADGGILAPGNSPGVLTVGALTMTPGTNGSTGSVLNYELGTVAAGNGPTSDLTNVTGNLTLAGTLNATAAGGFTYGSYRIFNYGGALTNDGLAIGTLPAGYTGVVQTVIPNQINLVVASPTTPVQFWDGPLTTGNATIAGGNGTWTNTQTNWTDPNGANNAAWGRGVGIFAGERGVVTVADTIAFQGLQFTTGGYNVVAAPGGTLVPTGQAFVRVSAGVFATIGATLTGSGGLEKLSNGTLVLTGTNTYAGGTTVSEGTLQIGNDGTTGSVVGNITDNAVLIFDRADRTTFGGVISGSGSVTQAGAGTLTLTGTDTYTGTTTISSGATLALAGAGSISGSDLSNAGTFDISQSGGASIASLGGPGAVTLGSRTLTLTAASDTFGGTIGGGGALVLQSGTEVLTGTNTYSGGTTIAGGTLQIGDGGTTGSITGNVVDNGTLAFDRSDAVRFDGAISGSGALAKSGAGVLTLSGANGYTGGTLLAQGTLAIGSAGAIGTGPLAMDAGTELSFTDDLVLGNAVHLTGVADPTIDTGSNTDTVSGPIAGRGALTKTGGGTLILTGTDPYTGSTTVAAGTLEVDGSTGASATTVDAGATLSGSGAVGSLAAGNGATVAPGSAASPYGTLRTTGSATFASGSTFQVSVAPTGQTSTLAVNGTATLGGAAVTVGSAAGTYDAATRYTILTATGGISGQFGTLSTAHALAFLDPYLSYTANAVTLAFQTNGTTFGSVALTPNERSVAAALQSLDPNSTLVRSLQGLSPEQARLALDALAGATHASATTTASQDARRVATQILDRLWNIGGGEIDARTLLQQLAPPGELPAFVNCYAPMPPAARAAPSSPVTAWGEAFGDFGHNGADHNGAGLDRSLGGFIVGYDTPLHGLGAPYRVGVAGGYTNTAFTGSGTGGSGSTGSFESVFGAIYGGARYGAIDVRAGVTAAGTSTTVNRTVAYPGFSEGEHSVSGGSTEQLFAELGYRFSGTRWVVEPIANAAYTHVHLDAFHERGGAAALFGFAQDDDIGTTTLGARAEYAPFVGVPLVGRAFLGWRHGFGDIDPATKLAFEAGSIPFTSQGAAIDRDALASELGVDWRASGAMTLGIAYTGLVGEKDSDNGVKGRLEYKF